MFSTLAVLKAHTLPLALQADTDYDVLLQTIGTGLAAMMQRYCNRAFERKVDDVFLCNGGTANVSLPRYPMETIDALELKEEEGADWEDISGELRRRMDSSGVLLFAGAQGGPYSSIRVTYTGGFWWDATGSDTLPAGAVELPSNIFLAWIVECRQLWELPDHTAETLTNTERLSRLATWQLSPETKNILDKFIRYA